MAAPTVNPSTHTATIGFPSGITIATLIRESVEQTSDATIEELRDEDNAEACSVISGKANVVTFTAVMPPAFSVPAKGSVITINLVKYLVTDVVVNSSRTLKRITVTARKPAVVTYS